MASLVCPFCKKSFEVINFLSQMNGYSSLTDSGHSSCPNCHQSLEFRVKSNEIEVGYTYWAGSLHFEAMEVFGVTRLSQHRNDDVITFEINGIVIAVIDRKAI